MRTKSGTSVMKPIRSLRSEVSPHLTIILISPKIEDKTPKDISIPVFIAILSSRGRKILDIYRENVIYTHSVVLLCLKERSTSLCYKYEHRR